MNPVLHFILGGNMTEDQWQQLGVSITNYYKPRIPFAFTPVFYRYTDDTFALIQKNYPTGPLVLAGHSFGGCRVAQVAGQFNTVGRVIDYAVLFDPVEITAWNKPNTAGFAMPSNVAASVCYYRGAKEAPFSGMITSGKNYKNVPYVGNHGDCVWVGQNVLDIGTALTKAYATPAPTPTPTPVPAPEPAKTVVSVTLTFSDGTSQVFKA